MKRERFFIVVLIVIVLLAPARLSSQARGQRGQTHTPPRPTLPPEPPPAAGPLSFADVIEALYSLSKGTGSFKSFSDIGKRIKERNVTFKAEKLVLETLKDFGATEEILTLIPPVPLSIPPPPPPTSGPVTIRCKPVDCVVAVNEKFYGSTQQGQIVVDHLPLDQVTVHVFSEGYKGRSQTLLLTKDTPVEADFMLEMPVEVNVWMVKAVLLETIRSVGGIDGMSSLGTFEGAGMLDWIDNAAQMQHWTITKFTKRTGKDIQLNFKTKDGATCTTSIIGSTQKHECKGKLKNSGEDVAAQATSYFLTYQLQDMLQLVLNGMSDITLGDNGRRLEVSTGTDSYVLTLGNDNLPDQLIHTAKEKGTTLKIKYLNYKDVGKGRYPAQMEIGAATGNPVFVFTFTDLKSASSRL